MDSRDYENEQVEERLLGVVLALVRLMSVIRQGAAFAEASSRLIGAGYPAPSVHHLVAFMLSVLWDA